MNPTISPTQEWKLHSGENKVPEWFTLYADRLYDFAYTRGRIDEAKTCEGCSKEKYAQVLKNLKRMAHNVYVAYSDSRNDRESRQEELLDYIESL